MVFLNSVEEWVPEHGLTGGREDMYDGGNDGHQNGILSTSSQVEKDDVVPDDGRTDRYILRMVSGH